jgi:hypothetical protein
MDRDLLPANGRSWRNIGRRWQASATLAMRQGRLSRSAGAIRFAYS